MRPGSTFQLPGLGKRKSTYPGNFLQSFLELVPHAAFIVDTELQVILFANSKTAVLSAYTRAELSGLALGSLFENWDSDSLTPIESAASLEEKTVNATIIPLITRNHQDVLVSVTSISLGVEDKRALVVLRTHPDRRTDQRTQGQFWEMLLQLQSAQWERDPDLAIAMALDAGLVLAGGEAAAFYQIEDHRPELRLNQTSGESDQFPDLLPIQDLVSLNKPIVWSAGKRTTTALHRAARTEQLNYLFTAPIGQPHAQVGLVAIAGKRGNPGDRAISITSFLSNIINTILQHQAQVDRLASELESKKRQNIVNVLVQEYMNEGILLLTPALEVIEFNQPAELILGYATNEIAGQPIERVLIADRPLGSILNAAQQASPTYNFGNIQLYRRNGEAFLAQLRVHPVIGNKRVDKIIVFIQDLSEQEQIRRQAQEYEQRAILGEVTAIFAHEVRNPINNISTGLQLMAYDLPEGDPNQESIQRMLQDCDRLAELIKSVLAFSRPADYEMDLLELSTLLENLLKRLQARITRQNIKHDLHIQAGCPPINGNQRALEQVFSNLIQNSLQAMEPDGGRLGVKLGLINDASGRACVEVSIADTGPGIPKELHERIFQPFVTTRSNGTGLGLAIAKRIVTAHKGNLTLTSFPGGTVFKVQLPVPESFQE
jgi:PAS domain S-box-containing protein